MKSAMSSHANQVRLNDACPDLFSLILDIAQDAILATDQNQNIVLFNQGATQVFGYTSAQVIGQPLDILLPATVVEIHRAHVRGFAESSLTALGMEARRQVVGRRKDGTLFPAEASIAKASGGGQTLFTVILRDITERKQVEDSLRDSEKRLHHLLTASPTVIYTMQVNGQDLTADWVGENILQLHGYTQEEALAPNWWVDHLHPDDRNNVLANMRRLFDDNHLLHEYRFRRKEGGYAWVRDELTLFRDSHGKPVEIVGTWIDITQRKQAEDRIRLNAVRAQVTADLATALASVTQSYHESLDIAARRIVQAIGDACVIYLVSPDGQWFDLGAYADADPEAFHAFRAIAGNVRTRIGDSPAAVVLKTGQPLLIPQVDQAQLLSETQGEYAAFVERFPAHSLLTVPIKSQGQTIGAIGLIRRTAGHPYTLDDQSFLQDLADRIGLAITNTRLYADSQRRLARLQILHSIDAAIANSLDLKLSAGAIVQKATAELGVDAVNLLALNPRTLMLESVFGLGFRTAAIPNSHVRLGEGYAGKVALDRQLVQLLNLKENLAAFTRAPLLAGEDFCSYIGIPLVAKGQVKGVLEIFHRTSLDPTAEWFEFLETIAGQAAIAIDNAQLFEDLQRSNLELSLAYDATIEGWSRAMDLRDKETEGHTQRVTALTVQLAQALGMSEEQIVHVRRGALLHDMGKLGAPDRILLKPEKLTEDEWAIMRQHPQSAYDMLVGIEYLRPALDIPYCHHEKWNGTGYPRGLKGEQIPLAARLFAVVDVWDALRSDRPYRAAWSAERVREHIRAGSGTHFDPRVVTTFLELVEKD